MVSSRAKTMTKLLLLLGLPLCLATALFGWGVYTGHTHRHAVTSFERDWLGMDVEVPPAPPKAVGPAADVKTSAPPGSADPRTVAPEGPSPAAEVSTPSVPPGSAPTSVAVSDLDRPEDPPSKTVDDGALGPESESGAPPGTASAPLGSPSVAAEQAPADSKLDPATRLHLPVVVQLKVLVDQDLMDAHPDWIDYVQRTVSAASLVFQRNFGIVLELVGVARWPVATAGLDAVALMQDLKRRSREGADMVVGFTERPVGHDADVRPEIPAGDSPYNGAYAVVYANPTNPEPHLRTLLHELGHLFGGVDIDDPTAEAYRSGSWMSGATVSPGSTPWIDPGNRERILTRKDKPFVPESRAETGGR